MHHHRIDAGQMPEALDDVCRVALIVECEAERRRQAGRRLVLDQRRLVREEPFELAVCVGAIDEGELRDFRVADKPVAHSSDLCIRRLHLHEDFHVVVRLSEPLNGRGSADCRREPPQCVYFGAVELHAERFRRRIGARARDVGPSACGRQCRGELVLRKLRVVLDRAAVVEDGLNAGDVTAGCRGRQHHYRVEVREILNLDILGRARDTEPIRIRARGARSRRPQRR